MENGGRAWDRFMMRLSLKSQGTQDIYLSNVEEFLERIGMDAEALFELRKADWSAEDPLDRGEVEDMVSVHVKYLSSERGLASGSVWNHIKSLCFFFKVIKMPLDLGDIYAPRKIYNGQRKVRADEIRVMLSKVGTEFHERNQAMIYMAKDTGLRMSDLTILDLEHYEKTRTVHNVDDEPFKEFRPMKTKKTGDLAHIRIGPEAIQAVEAWLEVRGREPGPLFTKRGGGRLHRKGASAMFLRKSQHLEDGYKVSGHSFRKFHKTGCEAGGIAEHWIRRLEGKAHDEYSAPTEEELTEAYMEAYDRLRISEESATGQKMIEELKRTVADQQRKIDLMGPAFDMAKRFIEQERELQKLRGIPFEPEDAHAKGG